MPAAPLPQVPAEHHALLNEWRKKVAEVRALEPLIEEEKELRRKVFAALFPNAKEGVNKAGLPAGWRVEADQKYTRKLDQDALPTAIAAMREAEAHKLGVAIERLFKYTAEISVSELRVLEKEVEKERVAKAAHPDESPQVGKAEHIYGLLSEVLTTKPALPTIKLIAPEAS
jgi:hypothetical protein